MTTAYVLGVDGFVEVDLDQWEPEYVIFGTGSRQDIAVWLDHVRDARADLRIATGWRLTFMIHYHATGIGIDARFMQIAPGEKLFIGPRENIGAAFLRNEREHLRNLSILMSCEAHMIAHGGLVDP